MGTYINGSIAPFTAGELANGAFKFGYGEYGYDILTRLNDLYIRDGKLSFFYTQDGRNYVYPDGSAGGPVGWGTAAIHNAVIEGLAGFINKGIAFDKTELSPAFIVTEHDFAYASVSYGSSDKYLAYTYEHDRDSQKIRYTIVGDANHIELKLLVPEGRKPSSVYINGTEKEFETIVMADSVYAVLSYDRTSNTDIDVVEVDYKEGQVDIVDKEQKKKSDSMFAVLVMEALAALAVIAVTVVVVIKKRNKNTK